MKRIIKYYKKRYYSIGFIICPALKNEKVYFNNYGFNHLIRKRGVRRFPKDIKERFKLLIYTERLLKSKDIKIRYRKSNVKYWALSKNLDNKRIKIVLRKIKNGKLHFYSIYEE